MKDVHPGLQTPQPYVCVFFELADPFPSVRLCHTIVTAGDESEADNLGADAFHAGKVPGAQRRSLTNWYVAPLVGGKDFHCSIQRWYLDRLDGEANGSRAAEHDAVADV